MSLVTVNNVEINDFNFNISKCICNVNTPLAVSLSYSLPLFSPSPFPPLFLLSPSPSLSPSLPSPSLLPFLSPDTYHVVSATIVSSNETTVCLECSFRHNSSSNGCYAVFHPINHTGGGVSYHKIMKSLVDTTASDCIDTLPNGVYSVSVLDALSYEEERYNNTAVTISSVITIDSTTSTTTLLLSPTAMIFINGKLCMYHVCQHLATCNILFFIFPKSFRHYCILFLLYCSIYLVCIHGGNKWLISSDNNTKSTCTLDNTE